MGFQGDLLASLDEHEQKVNENIKNEYSMIIKKINENMKILMATTASSYKRVEMLVKDEVKAIRDSVFGENDTNMSDPLGGTPSLQAKDGRKEKLVNHKKNGKINFSKVLERNNGKINKIKSGAKPMDSILNVSKNNSINDNLYNKWDNVDFLFDSPKPKRAIGGDVKIERIVDDNELSEGYGSMETEGDEMYSNSLSSLSNGKSTELSSGRDTNFKSGRIEDYFVKLDKFVEASNQRRRLVECKLCDTELRGDKIRLHILKEHSELSEQIDINKVGIRSIKTEKLPKGYSPKKELDSSAISISDHFLSTGKIQREKQKTSSALSKKEMRMDALKQRMEKAPNSEIDEDADEQDIKPFVTQLVQTVLNTEEQDESDKEESEEGINYNEDSLEGDEGLEPLDDENGESLNEQDQN